MTHKQSNSVQWFFDQLVAHGYIVVNKTTYGDKVKAKHEILLEQAKAMHKVEIVNAVDGFPIHTRHMDGGEYYEEIFEGEK